MDQSPPRKPAREGASLRPPVGAVLWALVFGALAAAGLAVLTCSLLVMHALVYGMSTVIAPEAGLAAPDSGQYGLAFAAGVTVHVVTASALTLLVSRTAMRTCGPLAQGLGTALVTAAVASCALLLTLGINPVRFVFTW